MYMEKRFKYIEEEIKNNNTKLGYIDIENMVVNPITKRISNIKINISQNIIFKD